VDSIFFSFGCNPNNPSKSNILNLITKPSGPKKDMTIAPFWVNPVTAIVTKRGSFKTLVLATWISPWEDVVVQQKRSIWTKKTDTDK
jgi:hypothetical protein